MGDYIQLMTKEQTRLRDEAHESRRYEPDATKYGIWCEAWEACLEANRRAPSPSQAEREAADRLQAQLDIDNALAMTVYRRDLEPVLTAIRARPAAPAGVPRSEVEALRDLLQKMAEDRIASANDATDRGQDIITGVASAYTAVAIRLDALLTLPTDPQEPAQAKEVSNQP